MIVCKYTSTCMVPQIPTATPVGGFSLRVCCEAVGTSKNYNSDRVYWSNLEIVEHGPTRQYSKILANIFLGKNAKGPAAFLSLNFVYQGPGGSTSYRVHCSSKAFVADAPPYVRRRLTFNVASHYAHVRTPGQTAAIAAATETDPKKVRENATTKRMWPVQPQGKENRCDPMPPAEANPHLARFPDASLHPHRAASARPPIAARHGSPTSRL